MTESVSDSPSLVVNDRRRRPIDPAPSPSPVAATDSPMAECTNSPAIMANNNDLSSLDNCKTYQGDITISNYTGGMIVTKLQSIVGDLSIIGSPGIVFKDLMTINGTLSVSGTFPGVTVASLSFPQLTQINDALEVSNTNLASFGVTDDLGLLRTLGSVSILSNPYMSSISLPMTTIDGQLEIFTNPNSNWSWPSVSFQNLQSAQDINVSYVHTFTADSLVTIKGNATIADTSIANLALDALTSAGSLTIQNPWDMTTLSLSKLKTTGGNFVMQGISYLPKISLPSLTEVGGALDISGNFGDINLPNLTSVGRELTVSSSNGTAGEFDCTKFLATYASQIQEEIVCDNTSIHTQTATTTSSAPHTILTNSAGSPTATTTLAHHKSSSSGLSTGAKAGIGVGVAIAGLIIIAIIAAAMLRRRRRKPRPVIHDQPKTLDSSPMIGTPTEQPQYQDSDPSQREYAGSNGNSNVLEDRPVSPLSARSHQRRSFGSRSVSPESVTRVPLGDEHVPTTNPCPLLSHPVTITPNFSHPRTLTPDSKVRD